MLGIVDDTEEKSQKGRSVQYPKVTSCRTFWGQLAAILDFAGGERVPRAPLGWYLYFKKLEFCLSVCPQKLWIFFLWCFKVDSYAVQSKVGLLIECVSPSEISNRISMLYKARLVYPLSIWRKQPQNEDDLKCEEDLNIENDHIKQD